tara:strand:+ start:3447 stop:4184 length:738 start_codon:yes stop_codon:yes gene_type:complete
MIIEDIIQNEDEDSVEVTVGDYTTKHFYMCGSAIETAEKYGDMPGMEDLVRLQDMFYKLEAFVMEIGEPTDEIQDFALKLHDEIIDQAEKVGIENEIYDYQTMHLNSIMKGDPEPGFGQVEIVEGQRCWKGYEKKGTKILFGKRVNNCVKKEDVQLGADGQLIFAENLDENLKKWFKDKWVRFGPDGKIRGDCARGSKSEGKPKCLPKSKAQSLGKKGRKTAANRKRKQDPDKNRRGKAKNVKTK